jgi:hypothetical protein
MLALQPTVLAVHIAFERDSISAQLQKWSNICEPACSKPHYQKGGKADGLNRHRTNMEGN